MALTNKLAWERANSGGRIDDAVAVICTNYHRSEMSRAYVESATCYCGARLHVMADDERNGSHFQKAPKKVWPMAWQDTTDAPDEEHQLYCHAHPGIAATPIGDAWWWRWV